MDGGIDRCQARRDINVNDERQEWINKRAYGLWEKEGRPHGKDQDHWEQAARERAEFEKVALPEHNTNRNSNEADDATLAAVHLTRRTPSGREDEPSVTDAAA